MFLWEDVLFTWNEDERGIGGQLFLPLNLKSIKIWQKMSSSSTRKF